MNGKNWDVDMIAIHCMAGNCTIETCGNIFLPTSRGASSHYGVGTDGRIGCYVEEENRSWCTGGEKTVNGWQGWMIDYRAITIEVANDAGAPDWHVSDTALLSTIKLCADICKRHKIKKLLWLNDPSAVPDVSRQNIMVHRWFAYKACPGDYLMSRMGFIADEVNKMLGQNATITPLVQVPIPTTSKTAFIRVTNKTATEKPIWDFLKKTGMTDIGAAAMMGNLFAESGLIPNNLQNSYEKLLGNDAIYTLKVNSKQYSKEEFMNDKGGYGLAQWTYWNRKKALYEATIERGKNIDDLGGQLLYLYWELTYSYKGMRPYLWDNGYTLKQSTEAVLKQFEKPRDQSDAVVNKRLTYATDYYKLYGENQKEQLYRVRKAWDQPNTQVGAFKIFQNAVTKATQTHLNVYDENGNLVYASK